MCLGTHLGVLASLGIRETCPRFSVTAEGISLAVDAEQMGPPAQTRDMEPGLVSVR